MQMANTRVLANWQPSVLDEDAINNELRELLALHGINSASAMTRDARYHHALKNRPYSDEVSGLTSWHTDNDNADCWIAVWSNILPTEVRFADGSLLETRNGDVILIKNREVQHRMPEAAAGSDRGFTRAQIYDRF